LNFEKPKIGERARAPKKKLQNQKPKNQKMSGPDTGKREAELIRLAAARGSPGAQYLLATQVLSGRDKSHETANISWAEAVDLLRQARSKGITGAIYMLAVCMERGDGCDKNPAAAAELMSEAAAAGHPAAMNALALALAGGVAGARAVSVATPPRRGADQLGFDQRNQSEVDTSFAVAPHALDASARAWDSSGAADGGHGAASQWFDSLPRTQRIALLGRDDGDDDTDEETTQGSRHRFGGAASGSDSDSGDAGGGATAAVTSKSAPISTDAAAAGAAARLFRAAALAGHSRALLNFAICVDEGRGVTADPERAFALYRAAAARGDDLDAVNRLCTALRSGRGCARPSSTPSTPSSTPSTPSSSSSSLGHVAAATAAAVAGFAWAARRGHLDAAFNLATAVLAGDPVPIDDPELSDLAAVARDVAAEGRRPVAGEPILNSIHNTNHCSDLPWERILAHHRRFRNGDAHTVTTPKHEYRSAPIGDRAEREARRGAPRPCQGHVSVGAVPLRGPRDRPRARPADTVRACR
jgi:TPR repeat protein